MSSEIIAPPKKADAAVNSGLAQLLESCSKGDPAALQRFFEKYSEDIYNFPMRVFQLDEDAASDFFLYAFERLKNGNRFRSFQGRSSFRTWFYTVLRNLVIDWMRTIKELDTVPARASSSSEDGNEYGVAIENIPAVSNSPSGEEEDILQIFQQELGGMPMELTVVFKLSYIYYLDLQEDELGYISERSGFSQAQIAGRILAMRHLLAHKEVRNIEIQDKLTSVHRSIMDLKSKRERLRSAMRNIEYPELVDTFELQKIEQALEKKYQQQSRLFQKSGRKKSIVRTPYRQVAELLKLPQSSISVQMMRALDTLRDSLEKKREK